ncbi:NADPH-dependent curcumin reductase CurA [Mycetocola sp. BIGb0189]|uniref:MDR family NADP-dependent oxidoreductase n=1 Tax=Mycetocola sp. BIGb0189 TaxID=2940604 RepID=UPI0021675CDD|nr:NADP-dependent oxidoreductase [Mycetocola sp. BIGb0189]MCS4275870.1 NADPH-dependent curcumin reductase CurA [Mycetocola sp. BIGb0189]
MSVLSHRFQLVARPTGLPGPEHFEVVSEKLDLAALPRLAPPTLLVQNVLFSVDPYHREMMDGDWALHAPLEGRSAGRVLASTSPAFRPGDLVLHRRGYSTHALVPAAEARKITPPKGVPLEAYLSILGGTGLTAYVGLTRIAELRGGQALLVTAAGGGVGTAAARIARLLGASPIVGITSSPEKATRLLAGGAYDRVIASRDAVALARLRAEGAGRFDAVLEGVGGDHLALAIDLVKPRGRIAWVGAIGQYTATEPPVAPRNLFTLVDKQVRLEGYLVASYRDLQQEFEDFLIPHILSGDVPLEVTVTQGFNQAIDALQGLFTGANLGKALVRLIPSV